MKKNLIFAVFFIFSGIYLFSWEPNDLTKFPSCTKEGDFTANVGFGLYNAGYLYRGSYFPSTLFSLDYNIAIGDQKLPFFAGGAVGYWGFNSRHDYLSIGGRFGYHFNWGVDNLDVYAVVTGGWIIDFDDGGIPLYGLNVGARYYLTNWFGFWAEAGYTSFSLFNIGVAFKF